MANKGIKGITIELGANTVGLDKALRDVNSRSRDLQTELKQVERALKFDPGNTVLISQQQQILADSVANTAEKLDRLKAAQAQVEQQFQSGDIGAEQYRAFQREVMSTESRLDQLRQSLNNVGDSASLAGVRQDLSQVGNEAETAQGSVKELGGELAGLAAGALAGGGIAGAIEQALDTSSLNTKIDISMDVPPESMGSVRDAINTVSSYGVDAEAALEGVRRQWALNTDASDESNQAVVNGAATIAAAFSGVDFTELVQETNEISKELGITNEEALGLTNSLLKMGFPPEQLDIISEYGNQLIMAGFSAEEVQAIMAAGVETGTWNIDNLLDGIKEGRIVAAEFGQEVPKAVQELLSGTDISAKQLQEWGKSVAAGGEGGSEAMRQIATALNGVDDETKKNSLGVALFGTLYEEQGQNIIDTLLNAKGATVDLKAGQDAVNDAAKQLDSTPAVQMQQAIANLKLALDPLLGVIANVISKVAEWVSNNPQLAATITAVVTAVGILMGIIMALAPIFTALSAGATAFGIGLLPLIGIVAGVVLAIAGLVAAGIAIYQNWDEIKAKSTEVWGSIMDYLSQTWESIKSTASTVWGAIKSFFAQWWDEILAVFTGPIGILVYTIAHNWDAIKETTSNVWNGIKNFFSNVWDGIKNVFTTVIGTVVSFVVERWNNLKSNTTSIFNAVKDFISTTWNNIKATATSVVQGIIDTVRNKFEQMKSAITEKMNAVKTAVETGWNKAKSFLEGINLVTIGKNIIQGIINGINDKFSGVKAKIQELAAMIPEWAKKILGIKSPSRVMQNEVGAQIGAGLAKGIDQSKSKVEKSSKELAKSAYEPVYNEVTKQIDDIFKQADKAAVGVKKSSDKIKKSFDEAMAVASNKYKVGKLDTSEYISALKAIQFEYAKTPEQMRKINEEIAKQQKDLTKKQEEENKKRFDNSKKWIDEQKKYNNMSLVEELSAWERVQTRYKEGTEQRQAAELETYRIKKEINDKLISTNKDYAEKMKVINDDLIKQEKDLMNEYNKTVESRTNSLYSFTGLFDEVNKKSDISGKQLIKNLQSQVSTFAQWAENIKELGAKGIDEGLLKELQDMGPKAAGEIAALNSLTNDQLSKYSDLWQEKNKLAKTQAVEELEGLRTETETKIDELRKASEGKLDELRQEWGNKISEIRYGTEDEFDALSTTLPEIGKNAIEGLMDGMDSMEGSLMDKARSIANAIKGTIQDALDIHSPSRVMRDEIGKMIPLGLAEGIESSMSAVSRASSKMAELTIPKIPKYNFESSSTAAGRPMNVIFEVDGEALASKLVRPIGDEIVLRVGRW